MNNIKSLDKFIFIFLISSILCNTQDTRIHGAAVNCPGLNRSYYDCLRNCPPLPSKIDSQLIMTWDWDQTQSKCYVLGCPPSQLSLIHTSDLFCQSCPGIQSSNNPAIFSNTYSNACVGATATCGLERDTKLHPWTDYDCNICNEGCIQIDICQLQKSHSNKYASKDGSYCQQNPISSSNDEILVSIILFLISILI